MENPFNLNDGTAYRRWRDNKLSNYPAHASETIVEIGDLANPSEAERAALTHRCMAIYVSRPTLASEGRVRNGLLDPEIAHAGAGRRPQMPHFYWAR